MIIPQFMRFYTGYTLTSVLEEYAKTFFALVNSMYQIQALEALSSIRNGSIINAEKDQADNAIRELRKSADGISAIVDEANLVRSIKK